MQGQMELFATATAEAPTAPPRTWATARKGERIAYDVPGSPYHGDWTIRRIEQHPSAKYLLIVDMVNDEGRLWQTGRHRDVPLDLAEADR